jgi:spermidine/putrescine transport system substrate-binding protein
VEVVARALGSTPVNLSAKTKLSSEEITAYRLDEPEYFKTRMILWPTITSVRTRNGLIRAWNNALEKAGPK